MDPLRNPYGPGAGTPPPELTGRNAILDDAAIALNRLRMGMPNKSFILVGLRGVGKTVLLNRIDEMARGTGYQSALIENTESKSLPELIAPQLRRILFELDRMGSVSTLVKRGIRVLQSFVGAVRLKLPGDFEFSLDVDRETGTADSGDLEADLIDLLVAVGEAALDRKAPVALIIDELHYLKPPEFSAAIMAMHRINQKSLPVIMIGAGLPQVVGLAGKSKSYAERLFSFPVVGALSSDDSRRALSLPAQREGARFDAASLDRLIEITAGYPYFVQEWGYHVWNVAAHSTITVSDVEAATDRAIARLDEGFFKVRFERLTPSEKRYARAMASLGAGPQRSGDIALVYGTDVTSAAPVRAKLVAKGMIYSPAHGDNAFTVPLFDEFLKRAMPVK